ncbi:MAG: DUF2254 domain-containing protein [Alphaproteobacteria bacterium]|nr:DUF2254 domain-containing protein [Alphaproteobacteria bacterium]
MRQRRPLSSSGLVPFLILFLAASLLYGALWFVDYGSWDHNPLVLWTGPAAYDVLLNFAEVTIGVLGAAITVVAILVELASTRYTARVTELFVRDRTNAAVMGFFVVTSVVVLWVEMSLGEEGQPKAMMLTATVLQTTSLLVLLPYFTYVFDFLSPTRVIERIQEAGSSCVRGLSGRVHVSREAIEGARVDVILSLEQLGDIALNSIENKDKSLTLAAVRALERLALDAIEHKSRLPEPWFDTTTLVRTDQDFIALHPDMVEALTERRTWLETKVFRQYQDVFGEALNRMRDVNHLIAIHTRHVAVTAIRVDDPHAVQLSIRFFNTYLRAAINARDVRSTYNLFNEYRIFAERAMDVQRTDLVVTVANHMKFYGQLAFGMNLAFLLETVAFDLCMLLERAHERGAECHDPLLDVFLDVDREPESKGMEASLRGVRKAQIRLATCYLVSGRPELAQRIADDMRAEPADRLRSIRSELERVAEQEYWEMSDRGVNFEWLPPERRATLGTFYAWLLPDPGA